MSSPPSAKKQRTSEAEPTFICKYFSTPQNKDFKQSFHHVAFLRLALQSVQQPLAFRDGEWVTLEDQRYLDWDGEAQDRHVAWLIRFIHTRFAYNISRINIFTDWRTTRCADWEKFMEDARLKLLQHACFARVEPGSLNYPLTFSCGDCCHKLTPKREKKIIPNEIMSYVSDKWRRDMDLLVVPLCHSCSSNYIDCDGNLDIPTDPMCGLCRRTVDLPKLKRPEEAVLDPIIDDEFEYSEKELEWLRTTSRRVSDFWCPACISQTVYCVGADNLVLMREAIFNKTF